MCVYTKLRVQEYANCATANQKAKTYCYTQKGQGEAVLNRSNPISLRSHLRFLCLDKRSHHPNILQTKNEKKCEFLLVIIYVQNDVSKEKKLICIFNRCHVPTGTSFDTLSRRKMCFFKLVCITLLCILCLSCLLLK